GVVDLTAERRVDGIEVALKAVRSDLDAIGEPSRQVVNELHGGVAVAAPDMPARNKLRLGVRRNPKPSVASGAANALHVRDVLGLRADETPDLINLQALAR